MMLKSAGFKEFVALMALSISLVALAIDAMLPALSNIANDLNVQAENDRQLILTVLFFGLAVGQIFYGPISDSFGRRRPVFFGFGLFILGSLLATVAQTFEALTAASEIDSCQLCRFGKSDDQRHRQGARS